MSMQKRGKKVLEAVEISNSMCFFICKHRKLYDFPVLPNPPVPRSEAPNSVAETH